MIFIISVFCEIFIDDERTVDEIFKGTPSSELMSKKLFCNFIREEEEAEEDDTNAESPTQAELPQEVPTTCTFVTESPYQENENSSPEPEVLRPETNHSEPNEEPVSLITAIFLQKFSIFSPIQLNHF